MFHGEQCVHGSVRTATCVLFKYLPVADLIQDILKLTFTNKELAREGFIDLIPPPYSDYVWSAAILWDDPKILTKMIKNSTENFLQYSSQNSSRSSHATPVNPARGLAKSSTKGSVDGLTRYRSPKPDTPVNPAVGLLWLSLAIRNRCFNFLKLTHELFPVDPKEAKKWSIINYAFETNDEHAISMADVLYNYGYTTSSIAYVNAIKSKNIAALEWLHSKALPPVSITNSNSFLDKAVLTGSIEVTQWVAAKYPSSTVSNGAINKVIDNKDYPMIEWLKTNRREMFNVDVLAESAIPSGDIALVDFIIGKLTIVDLTNRDNAANANEGGAGVNNNEANNDSDEEAESENGYDSFYMECEANNKILTENKIDRLIHVVLSYGYFEMFKYLHCTFVRLFGKSCIKRYDSVYTKVNRNSPDIFEIYEYIYENNLDCITFNILMLLINRTIYNYQTSEIIPPTPPEILEWFLRRLPYPKDKSEFKEITAFHSRLPRRKNLSQLTRELLLTHLQQHIDYWNTQ